MRTAIIAYIATAIVFFGMDFVWLGTMVNTLYKPRLGALLLDKPIMGVAGLFYAVYVVGIVAFAVLPALRDGDWTRAAWGGALLGLVAYGTYDMTNLSTIRGWSVAVSLADWTWGVVVTAVSAVVGYAATAYFSRLL